MKSVLVLILFIIPFLHTRAQIQDSEAFFNGSYDKKFIKEHKIKNITITNVIEGKLTSRASLLFDRKGFLQTELTFDSAGKKDSKYIFNYDDFGGLIERVQKEYKYYRNDTIKFTKVYTGGQLSSEGSPYFNLVNYYTYNSGGQVTSHRTFKGADTTVNALQKVKYKYNSKGKISEIEEIRIEEDGVEYHNRTVEYLYDAKGNNITILGENAVTYLLDYNNHSLLTKLRIVMPAEFNKLKLTEKYEYTFW